MEIHRLTCIGCPLGCPLEAVMEGGAVTAVTGNICPRGGQYARKELTAPARTVTTTLPMSGGVSPTVSVKTAGEIPKGMILACMAALGGVTVPAPVAIGQVLLSNVAGTGVDIVATRNVASA